MWNLSFSKFFFYLATFLIASANAFKGFRDKRDNGIFKVKIGKTNTLKVH